MRLDGLVGEEGTSCRLWATAGPVRPSRHRSEGKPHPAREHVTDHRLHDGQPDGFTTAICVFLRADHRNRTCHFPLAVGASPLRPNPHDTEQSVRRTSCAHYRQNPHRSSLLIVQEWTWMPARQRSHRTTLPLAKTSDFFTKCALRGDDGNRTRVVCLEDRGSTIELHPRGVSCLAILLMDQSYNNRFNVVKSAFLQ